MPYAWGPDWRIWELLKSNSPVLRVLKTNWHSWLLGNLTTILAASCKKKTTNCNSEFSFFLSKYIFLLLLKTILAETRLPNQQKPTFSSVWCLKTVPLRAFATVQWLLNICNIYYIGWKCKIYITLLLSEHSNIHLEEKSAVCQDWLHLLECSESTGRNVFPREVNRNCFPLNEICYVARGSMMYSVQCTLYTGTAFSPTRSCLGVPAQHSFFRFPFFGNSSKKHNCHQLLNFWHNSVSE